MKRTLLIAIFLALMATAGPALVFATAPSASVTPKVDYLLPGDAKDKGKEVKLPKEDLKQNIVPQAINIFLALAGAISFLVFVYAGIMLVISQGNEEEITKFKTILIWAVVGLTFITTAYAIVRGVIQVVLK